MRHKPINPDIRNIIQLHFSKEKSFIKYEWEELLVKMSNSDDPELRKRGIQELELLKSGKFAASRAEG